MFSQVVNGHVRDSSEMSMPVPIAELQSLSASLQELTERLTAIADKLHHESESGISVDLYEVERSLHAAQRRLTGALARA